MSRSGVRMARNTEHERTDIQVVTKKRTKDLLKRYREGAVDWTSHRKRVVLIFF